MLTKKQVEDSVTALTCADPACHWCVDMRAIAAAYERVKAWADLAESKGYTVMADELRRAIEG
jgi:hypothetical protein